MAKENWNVDEKWENRFWKQGKTEDQNWEIKYRIEFLSFEKENSCNITQKMFCEAKKVQSFKLCFKDVSTEEFQNSVEERMFIFQKLQIT